MEISRSIPRVDGLAKASGRMKYIDDMNHDDALYGRFLRSTVTRAEIKSISYPALPEGYYITDYRDVPGDNRIAMIKLDWPVFAEKEVRFIGQAIALFCGPDSTVVEKLLSDTVVEYEEGEGAVTLDEGLALKGGPIHGDNNLYADFELLKGGNVDEAFSKASRIIEGTYETGFQEQLYMEPQGLVCWKEGNKITIEGSMQCPYYVKHALQVVLGEETPIRVIQSTTGGAFGGKEDYPEIFGTGLAVASMKTGKKIKVIFDRREDLAVTSKRHPSRTTIKTAHDEKGRITAFDFDVTLDGGAYESYSLIVLQRAAFTSNGVYNFPASRVHGRACATNTVPSGAFRGFGAPQALFALEVHMDKIARVLGEDVLELRNKYLLKKGDATITNGSIHDDVIMDKLMARAEDLTDFSKKRKEYEKIPGKGIGLAYLNHGCGFTGDGEQTIIKAIAHLRKNRDDTVDILVANIDMGQGPKTTFRKLVSEVLDLQIDKINYDNPDTDKVPDSGPTVASRSMMVVGELVKRAAERLKEVWISGEEQLIEEHYKMPEGMSWEQSTMQGDAYPTYGWGVNIVEVDVDPLTYEVSVTDASGVYDVGVAIDQRVVDGQIQGGMNQVLGHAALEKLEVDSKGRFKQATLADYIIPTSLDFPRTSSDTIDNPYVNGPFGAKGMGEMVHDAGHAAFANAVSQALDCLFTRVPLCPEIILEEIDK